MEGHANPVYLASVQDIPRGFNWFRQVLAAIVYLGKILLILFLSSFATDGNWRPRKHSMLLFFVDFYSYPIDILVPFISHLGNI